MKKIILSILMLSVLLVSVGMVSSASFGVNFTSPIENSDVSDELVIKWENLGSVPGLYLQYADGNCTSPGTWIDLNDGDAFGGSETEYPWNTNEVDDGSSCLRLFVDSIIYDEVDFTIDNTEPVITTFSVNYDGSERDRPPINNEEKSLIYLYVTEENLDTCEIAWDDGIVSSCSGTGNYKHQYENSGNYDVKVTIKDVAGNEATDSATVKVANVAPENVAITTTQEVAASGEAVKFTASAEDVEADKPLTFTWTFDNDEVVSEFDDGHVVYTWDSASKHTVDLCVSDGDDETCIEELYEIEILDPIQLANQQVVAGEALDADFGDGTAKFPHSVVGGVCSLVPAGTPVGMEVEHNSAKTKCKVKWNSPKPTNDQRGEHHVTIQVINGDEFEYYSFDVTVYSWGIKLEKGWNLISIPYVPTSSDIDDVLGDIIENVAYEGTSTATVFQYNAVERVWYRARTTSTKSKFDYVKNHKDEELASIVPGYSYWIKMENEDWIYGAEKNFPVNTVPGANGIDLATESWNLIGRFGVDSASSPWWMALRTLRKPFYMDDYVSKKLGIYKLLSVTASGDTTWSSATEIEPTKGYWVRTAAGSEGRETVIYEPDSI